MLNSVLYFRVSFGFDFDDVVGSASRMLFSCT